MAHTNLAKSSSETLTAAEVNKALTEDATGNMGFPDTGVEALPGLYPNGDTDTGLWWPGANTLAWSTGGSERLRIDSSGNIGVGETAMDGLLTLNQGAADDNILTFKSSDVSHGKTGTAETDTYAKFSKNEAASGGLSLYTIKDGDGTGTACFYIDSSLQDTSDTTTSTGAVGILQINLKQHDGANSQSSVAADGNLAVFQNNGDTKHIFKGDGDIYYDGLDQGAYDDEDDISLVQAAKAKMAGWDKKELKKHQTRLQTLGIMEDTFISNRKMTALQLGCFDQIWNMIKGLANEVGNSENTLKQMAKQY